MKEGDAPEAREDAVREADSLTFAELPERSSSLTKSAIGLLHGEPSTGQLKAAMVRGDDRYLSDRSRMQYNSFSEDRYLLRRYVPSPPASLKTNTSRLRTPLCHWAAAHRNGLVLGGYQGYIVSHCFQIRLQAG